MVGLLVVGVNGVFGQCRFQATDAGVGVDGDGGEVSMVVSENPA